MPDKNRLRGSAVYQQQLLGVDGKGGVVESLNFWGAKSNKYVASIRQHSKLHGIHLVMEDHESAPGDIYVVAKFDTRSKSSWDDLE
ncbi:hypothetical protein [Lysobacter sp. CA199]|uniref:hypothetical protein n=1 Tax=Lysobacter sp. CA199 TaxID=3455608 RepID=UPI003F8D8978